MLGDNAQTLIPACHAALEAEANFAAGRLLFLRDRFVEECLSNDPSFDALKDLKATYGNTYSTTFWRSVETWGRETPMVGLITGHPHPAHRNAAFDPAEPCKHFIQSLAFAKQFSGVKEMTVFDQIVEYCGAQKGGPLGQANVPLIDNNGDDHIFFFESFSFHHQTLTLGTYYGPRNRLVAVA